MGANNEMAVYGLHNFICLAIMGTDGQDMSRRSDSRLFADTNIWMRQTDKERTHPFWGSAVHLTIKGNQASCVGEKTFHIIASQE